MDGYPYSDFASVPAISVPYIDGAKFDYEGDFTGFPERIGWSKVDLLHGNVKDSEAHARLVQSWLFFGLIASALSLEKGKAEEMFVKCPATPEGDASEHRHVITTEKLADETRDWVRATLKIGGKAIEERLERAAACVEEASVFFQSLLISGGKRSSGERPRYALEATHPELCFLVMAVGDQLWAGVQYLESKAKSERHEVAEKLRALAESQEEGRVRSALKGAATQLDKSNRYIPVLDKGGALYGKDSAIEFLMDLQLKGAQAAWDAMSDKKYKYVWPPEWGFSRALHQRFIQTGWCPYEARRAQDILAPWAAHYASAMTRHYTVDHSPCTDTKCGANNVNEETYKTKHTKPSCKCEFVGLSDFQMTKMKFLLDRGTYPLIELTHNKKAGTVSLAVVEGSLRKMAVSMIPLTGIYQNMSSFIAVSHVWSQGLGNAKDNALPTCQLIRINNMVTEATGEGLMPGSHPFFWIDTLCIPLDPEYRSKAIALMTKVFAHAFKVLIIDDELKEAFRKEDYHRTENNIDILMRIYCSTWMQRMWTFQEGASMILEFAVDDKETWNLAQGLKNHKLKHRRLPIAKGGDKQDVLLQMIASSHFNDANRFFLWMRQVKQMEHATAGPESVRLAQIWNGLRWREATKSGDESLVVASMVHGKVKHANDLRPEFVTYSKYDEAHRQLKRVINTKMKPERWRVLYEGLKFYPQGVLFVDCQTLPDEGLRWAPCEIGTDARNIIDATPGYVTPEGLKVKFPGFMFRGISSSSQLPAKFSFPVAPTDQWYEVTPMRTAAITITDDDFPKPSVREPIAVNLEEKSLASDTAIAVNIVPSPPPTPAEEKPSAPPPVSPTTPPEKGKKSRFGMPKSIGIGSVTSSIKLASIADTKKAAASAFTSAKATTFATIEATGNTITTVRSSTFEAVSKTASGVMSFTEKKTEASSSNGDLMTPPQSPQSERKKPITSLPTDLPLAEVTWALIMSTSRVGAMKTPALLGRIYRISAERQQYFRPYRKVYVANVLKERVDVLNDIVKNVPESMAPELVLNAEKFDEDPTWVVG